ncbi:MAG TPA: hybrid sensor histidine kinase/response regulator [Vicinamibacterales bacterium]|jgi:signal transduction histidine kinase|nr:hybrid sensor histidine kinase/response regulator [Vicinamibacterales bacterium]
MTVPADVPKVLIVDDQPRNLDALEVMLGQLDCALVRAASADEALLALLSHEFAAIVLDIRMPDMSGIELAALIKQRKRLQHVPILLLTAHTVDDRDVLQGYGAGAVDYLSKPIDAEILRSKVGVFVDIFTKTRELSRLAEALQAEIAERERVQAALEEANRELERRVRERTAALVAARDEAERQSRLKDEFLASLSHELRTPMNVILGWLSMLETGMGVRDVQLALATVRRNAELQAKLIDDLLDMSRLTSGTLRLEMDRVDLGQLLETTLRELQPAADRKGVTLVAAVSPDLRAVAGDDRRLQQVLWNLLHNAVKFTPPGGRVVADIRMVDGCVEIVVQDNGRGISPAFLPHVFDRFRQEHGISTSGTAGLGLGLAITRQLVELHGGTIRAWSAGTGTGATFVVRVPAASATEADVAPGANAPAVASGL